ncbi:hypothetical protein [Streptomyces flaveolus]|uniref:hypothetical protein n=1 Tax=Streptomyces flaveolus TaxID=67297 RepID=UPI00166FD01C|nr:hypothetical protein [Streptomyces flaveolus]GGQ81130.1 hypothetical protein GCM10010216_48710 [Streptomyces flaveolus]
MQHTARPRTARDDLQTIVDHWQHLRALIDTTQTVDTWPPNPSSSHADYLAALDDQDAAEVSAEQQLAAALAHALDHPQQLVTRHDEHGRPQYRCAHCDHTGEGIPHPAREDRDPMQLGERPVPIRLHVADASRAIEIALCSLADTLAARDALDPADWHARDRAERTAPNAAKWLQGRLSDEPCCTVHDAEQQQIARYAREAADRLDRVVGLRRSTAVLGMPCPWCGGELVADLDGDVIERVMCGTGLVDCSAPAPFDISLRARVWSTPEQLVALQREIHEAAHRRKRADARARQRAAARARQDAAA